jgi:hypothetical protein
MAAISSAGSGNWSSTTPNAPWPSGVIPTAADDVTILNGHTITLDTITAVARTIVQNAGSSFIVSNAVNTAMVVERHFNSESACTYTCDLSSAPTITHQMTVFNSAVGANNVTPGHYFGGSTNFTIKGAPRTRNTLLTTALVAGVSTSCDVADVSGWRIGDSVVFGTTQAYNATPRTDAITITGITGNTISWTGAVTYDHAVGGRVGNFTSNVKYKPVTAGRINQLCYKVLSTQPTTPVKTVTNVQFENNGTDSDWSRGAFFFLFERSVSIATPINLTFDSNAFYNYYGMGIRCHELSTPLNITNCNFYTANCNSAYHPAVHSGVQLNVGDFTNCHIYRHTGTTGSGDESGFGFALWAGNAGLINCSVSGTKFGGIYSNSKNLTIVNTDSYSNFIGITHNFSIFRAEGFRNGVFNSGACTNLTSDDVLTAAIGSYVASFTQTLNEPTVSAARIDQSRGVWVNKNNDPLLQEIYRRNGAVKRNNVEKFKGLSSLAFKCIVLGRPLTESTTVSCPQGQTINLNVNIKLNSLWYNSGTCTYPTVTISGLGKTPVVATATSAANNAWQTLNLVISNDVAGYDGDFTITFSCTALAVTTGTVYFDGIVYAPFVTYTRRYGYKLSDFATNNKVIETQIVASEATALAYTGVTLSSNVISFSTGTADAFQKFYDYVQAWCVADAARQIPLERAGGTFLVTPGWTIENPYYSGSVTWSGGNIRYTSPGTKADNIDGSDITFTAVGTYTLSGVVAGNVELINTSAGAVVVNVPSGTTYTNTGPNITVNVIVPTATASITGLLAGSRVHIYNITKATAPFKGYVAGTSYTDSYTEGTTYEDGDIIAVRTAWLSVDMLTATLSDELRTVATSNGWSILASQEDDAIFNALQADALTTVDPTTITEFTSDYPNVQFDITDPDGLLEAYLCYIWYRYKQWESEASLDFFFQCVTAENIASFRINVDKVNLHFQNIGTNSVQINGRVYRSDGSRVFVTGNGPVQLEYGDVKVVTVNTTGSPVITGDVADVLAAITPIPTNTLLTTDSRLNMLNATAIGDAVGDRVIETYTQDEMQRVMFAALAGRREGLGTFDEKYMSVDGTITRLTFVADPDGNGTPVIDGTP